MPTVLQERYAHLAFAMNLIADAVDLDQVVISYYGMLS